MQAVGIIAEYNPFHNGHQWHLHAAKQHSGCSFVIGIMSGHFVQRGEPAIFDKWKRAEMAIHGGIDLIIELPTVFAVRSAQYFAAGGIRLLNSLGIVSHVCFGAEHADLDLLKKISATTDNPQFIQDMHTHLKSGKPYAAAFGHSLEYHCNVSSNIIASPNNILAVEYLRAIKKFAPNLVPIPVTRQQSQYNDTVITTPFASATSIRHELLQNLLVTEAINSAIPSTTADMLNNSIAVKRGPVSFCNFSNIILAQLRTVNLKNLEQLPGVSEGLHYRIQDCALRSSNIDQFFSLLKSKRYSLTRLQRILIHSLLGTTQNQLMFFDEQGPLYARILAFNQNGRLLLKYLNKHSNIPLVTKTTHFLNSKQRGKQNLTPLQHMLSIDTIASDVYVLGIPLSNWNAGAWDFRYPALYIP